MFGSHFLSPEIQGSSEVFSRLVTDFRNIRQNALVLARHSEGQVAFLLLDGALWPTCVVSGEPRTLFDAKQALNTWPDVMLASGSLPVFMLRSAKIWFSFNPPPKAETLLPGDFSALLGRCASAKQPSMLWVQCGLDEFFVFVPGSGKAADQVVDVSTGELVSDPVLVSPLLDIRCAEVKVEHFPFVADIEAWQEYRLHRFFCDICDAVLRRHSELTGRVMVQSLVRIMNVFIENGGWPIEFRAGVVNDCLVLPSLVQTREVYKAILTQLLDQASQVVGKKLIGYTLADYLSSVPADARQDIQGILPAWYSFSFPSGVRANA